ncbi:MAG TPA: DUF4350 domain-containing protein [Desulfuromonadaceae bacterium]|nr:DUF4350 domain-containing protein [Desulfuromonadaceae bacterium]
MATKSQSSFSSGRKWKIGFDLILRSILVIAVVVMANYLGAQFSKRFFLSPLTRVHLSSSTINVLQGLSNRVDITLYYDHKDDFYPDIVALLNEYCALNSKISYRTVDYLRDTGLAEKVKQQYGLSASTDKNLIIFDSSNRVQVVNGDALIKYAPTGMTKDRKVEFSAVGFNGELMFSSIFLMYENTKPYKAYFLQDHGEGSLTDAGDYGFAKFGSALAQKLVSVTNLELSLTADVPADCNLLIIAAPTRKLDDTELQKIDQYLAQGGRLFVLLNMRSIRQATGLEPILERWGIEVAADYVSDPLFTMSGPDVKVVKFAHHPVVDALAANDLPLQLFWPRPILGVNWQSPPPDAPQVTELAFSSPGSSLAGNTRAASRSYSLIAAAEQKNVAGVVNVRGTARIIVAGDSVFLGNAGIEAGGNRDFLGYAVNWLLERPNLLQGIGPRKVTEFRMLLTRAQQKEIQWLLLGALPGAVMLLGGLVWFARRR